MELYARAAELGYNDKHHNLAGVYHEGGDLEQAKFHFEAAARQEMNMHELILVV